jgi:hypothetical protein
MTAVPEHCFAALVKFADGYDSLLPVIRAPGRSTMRRSTAGQRVEEVKGERAGVLLNDLRVRRNCVILKGPA